MNPSPSVPLLACDFFVVSQLQAACTDALGLVLDSTEYQFRDLILYVQFLSWDPMVFWSRESNCRVSEPGEQLPLAKVHVLILKLCKAWNAPGLCRESLTPITHKSCV